MSNQPKSGFDDATVKKSGKSLDGEFRIPATSSWTNAWRMAAGIGGLGIAVSAWGYTTNPERFAFSYLFAFLVFLTIALGSIFFILIERLVGASWSISVRRTAEFFAAAIGVFALLFLPILATRGTLFPWMHAGQTESHEAAPAEKQSSLDIIPEAHAAQPGAHEQPPGAHGPRAHRPGQPTSIDERGTAGPKMADASVKAEEEENLHKKQAYLNVPFFLGRALFYFIIWTWLATRFFNLSTSQDKTKDPKFTVAAQRFAPGATILFALTLTFAAFDWIMSLDPTWFSTIFGVCIFASCVVSMFCVLIITTMALRSDGLLKNSVTVEHYHDMGKYLFGFIIFWAYVNFSQFMLIWYAALPEETTFFHHRWDDGPWKTISLLIVIMHFVVPFFLILSRNVKRRLPGLRLGAAILLVMHVVEMYWLILPNYNHGDVSFSILDASCLCAVGGVYLAVVLRSMTKHPLIPVGDPRLPRSLAFENA